MPVKERLTLAEIAAGDLIATHHQHRYHFAAGLVGGMDVLDLCCGSGYGSFILAAQARSVLGVDVDPGAVREAEVAGAAVEGTLAFRVGDALEAVKALDPGAVGAIVCFEGIEHVPDPEALADALAERARDGTRVVLSLPNSRAFGEENPFHVTDFGYEEILALLRRFDDHMLLRQYLAEGSLIVDGDDPDAPSRPLRGVVADPARAEPEWANQYLAISGVDREVVREGLARMRLAANPNANAYVRGLEAANRSLHRANVRLGRGALGTFDAAAASFLARNREENLRLKAELAAAEERARRAEYSAWENDQWLQEERARSTRLGRVADVSRRFLRLGR